MFKLTPTGKTPDTFADTAGVAEDPTTGQYEITTPGETAPIAVPRERPAIAGVSGDWDERDFKFPRLNIVMGNGELKTKFPEAAVVVDDSVLLQPPARPNARPDDFFRFVPIGIKKLFKEYVSAEQHMAGVRRRYADSVEEVTAMGGTTAFGAAGERPSWGPCATVTLILEQPEKGEGRDHPLFSIEIDGKKYTPPIQWNAYGASFKMGASLIFSALSTILTRPVMGFDGKAERNDRGGIRRESYLPLKFWEWRTALIPWGAHPQFGPKLQAKEETSPALRDYCDSLMF